MTYPSPQITFCAAGRSGIGHLRRIANIAGAVRHLCPDAKLELRTNAGIDALQAHERDDFDKILIADPARMAIGIMPAIDSPVIVDTAIVPNIERLPNPLCLILAETADHRVSSFNLPGSRTWDSVIVPNPHHHWLPNGETIRTKKIDAVGWVLRRSTIISRAEPLGSPHGKKLLLVATGTGETKGTGLALKITIDAILELVVSLTTKPLEIIQVLGTRADFSAKLDHADRVLTNHGKLHDLFSTADIVISTAGYNSVLELASTDVPTLLIGIPRTDDDQYARARYWGPKLGLSHEENNVEQSAGWIVKTLARQDRRAVVDLGDRGEVRCAQAILELAATGASSRQEDYFDKSYHTKTDTSGASIARRTIDLATTGIRTPIGAYNPQNRTISFRYISGITARDTIDRKLTVGGSSFEVAILPVMTDCLQLLANLHGVPTGKFRVSKLDPWRRVSPRLNSTGGEHSQTAPNTHALAIALMQRTQNLLESESTSRRSSQLRPTIVHGDFHLRQILIPDNDDEPWLLDLDGLALGPPEFDLANFVVNIVTTPSLSNGALVLQFRSLIAASRQIYESNGGRKTSELLCNLYGAVALVRRALKFSELNRQTPSPKSQLDAAASLVVSAYPSAAGEPNSIRN